MGSPESEGLTSLATTPPPPKKGPRAALASIWASVRQEWAALSSFWRWLLGGIGILAGLAVFAFAVHLLWPSGSGSGDGSFPEGGPAEFLYLDAARDASYLAQIDGGSYEGEKVVHKLAESLNAGVKVPGGGEAGATRAREILTERVLQPTDASAFFDLAEELRDDHIKEVGLRDFQRFVHDRVAEGEFVEFETSAIVAPRYLNAFLAVRQKKTLEELFPYSKRRQRLARAFLRDVGRNPRAVIAIRPKFAQGEREGERKPVAYLMPIRARSLTAERSLIKYGGGRFTVIGKLVRDFPEKVKSGDHTPAYIDSPTLETWELPLRRAPRELLCRTEQQCIDEVRTGVVAGKTVANGPLEGEQRHKALKRARHRILDALRSQTTIEHRGAVILPVAIYK